MRKHSMASGFALWTAALAFTAASGVALAADAASDAMPAAASTTSSAPAPTASKRGPGDPVEQRIADLHSALGITSDQESKWGTFAQAMRDNDDTMRAAFQKRASDVKTLNAADNMNSWATIAQTHAQAMQKLATTFSDVYSSLSDAQKAKADTLFRQQMEKHIKAAKKHRKAAAAAGTPPGSP